MKKTTLALIVAAVALGLLIMRFSTTSLRVGDKVVAKTDCALFGVAFTSGKVYSTASFEVEKTCNVAAGEKGFISTGPEGGVIEDVDGAASWCYFSLLDGCEGYSHCGYFERIDEE